MIDNLIDTKTAKKLEFLTHTFYLQRIDRFVGIFCNINDSVYYEMEISSRHLSYTSSLHDRNLALLAGAIGSMFGIEPNPDFLFLPKPIENERYLIYRYIYSIFQIQDKRLYIFSSDNEFKSFCNRNNLEYYDQWWFDRLYFEGTDSEAEEYLIKNSLIFQELYFPSSGKQSVSMPTLHDVEMQKSTYKFKSDFAEIYDILYKHNIAMLYHFTDKANLKSILKYGILSADELNRQRIQCKFSSSDASREIDREMGLSNYVRLSFVKSHPMMYTSMTARGIHPVVIEINPFIALMPDVYFSDRNALRKGANIGPNAADLRMVNFDIINSTTAYYNMGATDDKVKYQAEILVNKRIGPEMILNYRELAAM